MPDAVPLLVVTVTVKRLINRLKERGVSWYVIVKGWHFAEFAILMFLVAAALNRRRGSSSYGAIAGAVIFAVLFAASDEWHQSFVPDRIGSVQDVLIDCGGVFAAGLLLVARHRRKNCTEPNASPERRHDRTIKRPTDENGG